ncbi:MAG TPA: hypothetical protein VEB69_02260 [Acidimicrobiia bacterium]|nr:hypothetical protein [Acidimicrobiia bacterium]
MEIRPRSFGENLNEWFRAMGKTWRPLLLLCAFAYVPLGLLTGVLLAIPGTLNSYFDLFDPTTEPQSLAEFVELLGPLIWAGAVWTILQLVATALVYVAAGRALAVAEGGGESTAPELLRFAWRRLGRALLAGLMVAVGVVVIVAAATLIVWGLLSGGEAGFMPIFLTAVVALTTLVLLVWLGVGVSLYIQAIAMEDGSAAASVGSSFRMVRRRWWPTFGFELVTGLMVSAAGQVLVFVLVPILLLGMITPILLAIGYGLTTMLQGPIAAGIGLAYAVWYVDLRAREGPLSTDDLI